jgi:hypothetical protein
VSASFQLTLDTTPPQPLFGSPGWGSESLRIPYGIDEEGIIEAYFGDIPMTIDLDTLTLADPPEEDRLVTVLTRDEVDNEGEFTLLVIHPEFGMGTAGRPVKDASLPARPARPRAGVPSEGGTGTPS